MSQELAELQARQIVGRLHTLRFQVELFAMHAKTLRTSPALDPVALLKEAGILLLSLKNASRDFGYVEGQASTVSRGLSSRAPDSGMPPAAKWGNEFRAARKQFSGAVLKAESEIKLLYGAANEQLNRPTRTATSPDNLLDILVNFIDLLTHWIESRRGRKN